MRLPGKLLRLFLVSALPILVDLEFGAHVVIVELHVLDVVRLARGQPREHVTLRLEVLQLPVQLPDVDVVVRRLVGLHTVLQKLVLLTQLLPLLLKLLVLVSQRGQVVVQSIDLRLKLSNLFIFIIVNVNEIIQLLLLLHHIAG